MSDTVVSELKRDCESLISAGSRLANSMGILLHGNLRSLNHMIDKMDAAVLDWNSLTLGISLKLQQLKEQQNENECGQKCDGSGSHSCADCSKSVSPDASNELHSCLGRKSETQDEKSSDGVRSVQTEALSESDELSETGD